MSEPGEEDSCPKQVVHGDHNDNVSVPPSPGQHQTPPVLDETDDTNAASETKHSLETNLNLDSSATCTYSLDITSTQIDGEVKAIDSSSEDFAKISQPSTRQTGIRDPLPVEEEEGGGEETPLVLNNELSPHLQEEVESGVGGDDDDDNGVRCVVVVEKDSTAQDDDDVTVPIEEEPASEAPPQTKSGEECCDNFLYEEIDLTRGVCEEVFSPDYEEVEFTSPAAADVSSEMGGSNSTVEQFGNTATCNSNTSSPLPSLDRRRSLVEEVLYEVERVQRQHAQGLRELNLDVEKMLLSQNGVDDTDDSPKPRRASAPFTQRELPSLPKENVTSDSPKITSKREMVSALKMEPVGTSTPLSKRRGWIRLPSLSGIKDKPHAESYSRVRESAIDEPVYMLYDDSHRQSDGGYYRDLNGQQSGSSAYSDDGIYEDIDHTFNTNPAFRHVPKTQMNRQRSETNGGEDFEEFEPYEDRSSDTESEKSYGRVSLASIKNTLRNVVTRRMSKSRDDSGLREKDNIMPSEKRHTYIFPWRKEYDLEKNQESMRNKLPQVSEEIAFTRIQLQPPTLPAMPAGLSPEQVKRRYIVSSLVHSENTYVATLKRILHDYKKPLEDSHPPILSKAKIDTLFFRISEIQQCHAMFRIALADCVRRWDRDEKIGDVFIASFSKSMVLDMYSGFINNFSAAMELAKQESKRKSAFADFLKVKQITSHDRLSFFGLMVKPVQRFPQFILLLQDLLKHTPHHHPDRMNLQLALTQLESLAEMLNERKRESEQHHAVKELLHHVSTKFSLKPLSDGGRNHYLLRQDNFSQLKFDQDGQIAKTKDRRLYLLNELLVCVSVSLSSPNSLTNERYSLKWAVPVCEVEIQEELSPNLNRFLTGGLGKANRNSRTSSGTDNAHALYQEMSDLMSDFEVLGRISALVSSLKKNYHGLNTEIIQAHSQSIMQKIQEKDEEVKWLDNCCLQLQIPTKNKNTKELITFQTNEPMVTKEWIAELRMAQLALDANNSPAWDIPEQELRPSTKMPLFVRAMPVHTAAYANEVKTACYYTCLGKPPSSKKFNYLWVCSSDGVNSHISILCMQQVQTRKVASFDLAEVRISTMEAVPGIPSTSRETKLKGWTIWMGTDSRRIMVFSGSDPEQHENLGHVSVNASVLQLRYYCDCLFAGLANGSVVIFRRSDQGWCLKENNTIVLSTEPVTSLLPYNNTMYCACGRKVWLLDCASGEVTKNFTVNHEQLGNVYLLAQSGIGLWINLRNTATICLYHMETFKHLQDINIAANINRVLADRDQSSSPRCIFVTSLLACRGLLWVGTNVGVALTIPLPRLEGVPIISGRASLSYHMMAGPVTTLVALTSPSVGSVVGPVKAKEKIMPKLSKQLSYGSAPATPKVTLRAQLSTPSLFTGPKHDVTPPSPLSKSHRPKHHPPSIEGDYDVYGLYGDLLNVREYFDDGGESALYEPLRRSEPDLLLPTAVSTLDRRLRMKAGRPKSLDLANLLPSEPIYVSSSSEGGSSTASSAASIAEAPELGPKQMSIPTEIPRTLLTIMGGRGYRNARASSKDGSQFTDAYILLWEMKL